MATNLKAHYGVEFEVEVLSDLSARVKLAGVPFRLADEYVLVGNDDYAEAVTGQSYDDYFRMTASLRSFVAVRPEAHLRTPSELADYLGWASTRTATGEHGG